MFSGAVVRMGTGGHDPSVIGMRPTNEIVDSLGLSVTGHLEWKFNDYVGFISKLNICI